MTGSAGARIFFNFFFTPGAGCFTFRQGNFGAFPAHFEVKSGVNREFARFALRMVVNGGEALRICIFLEKRMVTNPATNEDEFGANFVAEGAGEKTFQVITKVVNILIKNLSFSDEKV